MSSYELVARRCPTCLQAAALGAWHTLAQQSTLFVPSTTRASFWASSSLVRRAGEPSTAAIGAVSRWFPEISRNATDDSSHEALRQRRLHGSSVQLNRPPRRSRGVTTCRRRAPCSPAFRRERTVTIFDPRVPTSSSQPTPQYGQVVANRSAWLQRQHRLVLDSSGWTRIGAGAQLVHALAGVLPESGDARLPPLPHARQTNCPGPRRRYGRTGSTGCWDMSTRMYGLEASTRLNAPRASAESP